MYPLLRRIDNGDGTITLYGPCAVTGENYSVTVKAENLAAYDAGEYVQRAFPDLSKDDREFIISGTSPQGWRLTFTEEAAEEDGVDTNDIAALFDWLVNGKDGNTDSNREGPKN